MGNTLNWRKVSINLSETSENPHGESEPMHQIVVDTDILILHLRGNELVRKMLREAAQDSLLCCSAITIGEINAGMRDEERARTEKLLNSLAVINVDRKIAALAGDYRRTIKSHHLELDDCLIAATCVINQATLITSNIKQYPMKGLEKKVVRITP
jgi:predicted nucleic acid-binding protein